MLLLEDSHTEANRRTHSSVKDTMDSNSVPGCCLQLLHMCNQTGQKLCTEQTKHFSASGPSPLPACLDPDSTAPAQKLVHIMKGNSSLGSWHCSGYLFYRHIKSACCGRLKVIPCTKSPCSWNLGALQKSLSDGWRPQSWRWMAKAAEALKNQWNAKAKRKRSVQATSAQRVFLVNVIIMVLKKSTPLRSLSRPTVALLFVEFHSPRNAWPVLQPHKIPLGDCKAPCLGWARFPMCSKET